MRWLALLLIAANIALMAWLYWSGENRVHTVREGRLPRVAEIQLIDGQNNLNRDDLAPVLSEVTPVPSDDPRDEQPEPKASTTAQSETACFGVGWFDEQEHALAYLRQLEREHVGLRFLQVSEHAEPLDDFHWVLIPPLPSRADAMALYRELVGQGIEAYVVQSGERENSISLGLFRSLDSAEEVLERRQAENIDATLVKFPRNRISYALVFRGVADPALLGRDAAPDRGDDGLQLIEFSACEGVATAEENP